MNDATYASQVKRIEELKREIRDAYRHGWDPQRQLCELVSIEEEMDEPTYKITRFTFNDDHPDNHKVIATGLTLEQAQEHCNDDATHGEDAERGQWFDGFTQE